MSRAKLAPYPLHKRNTEVLKGKGAMLSIERSVIQRAEPAEYSRL
jgi:hypothetical protein